MKLIVAVTVEQDRHEQEGSNVKDFWSSSSSHLLLKIDPLNVYLYNCAAQEHMHVMNQKQP